MEWISMQNLYLNGFIYSWTKDLKNLKWIWACYLLNRIDKQSLAFLQPFMVLWPTVGSHRHFLYVQTSLIIVEELALAVVSFMSKFFKLNGVLFCCLRIGTSRFSIYQINIRIISLFIFLQPTFTFIEGFTFFNLN